MSRSTAVSDPDLGSVCFSSIVAMPVRVARTTWGGPRIERHVRASTGDEEEEGDDDLPVDDPMPEEDSDFDDFDDDFDDDFEEEPNDPDWDHPDDDLESPPPPAPGKKK